MGTPSSLGGHPQLGLRRLPYPASLVLPPFQAVGALPAVDPQGLHVLGDGTPYTRLLMVADPQRKYTQGKEEEAGDGCVAAVDPLDSEDEEAKDEYEDNRNAVIRQ
ncbi:hypothetical protein NDU88_002641 [Pleurodeles waltl]|uniref:Uncharacterized protein n=1 Tax=Pleurodeles waltl TaxID=8319 RepID=A0AAV7VBS5_PLEWA|nr:hypothetical protein NDU88_002641 [Pleurodeles waltl]